MKMQPTIPKAIVQMLSAQSSPFDHNWDLFRSLYTFRAANSSREQAATCQTENATENNAQTYLKHACSQILPIDRAAKNTDLVVEMSSENG